MLQTIFNIPSFAKKVKFICLDMFKFEDLEMNNSLLNRSQEERFAINVQVHTWGKTRFVINSKCMYYDTQNCCYLVRCMNEFICSWK